ncbi:MAG: YdjY domain-containing protein [Pirellulaceae bacterium]|nr:YdjY domain-containing protein [Pirellulaceae bacterium]
MSGSLSQLLVSGMFCAVLAAATLAQESKPAEPPVPAVPQNPPADVSSEPAGLVKLSKTGDVWLDTKRKAVIIDGDVCLREGQLEMFACPKGTKEHESVVALKCLPEEVHAGLLAAGAKPGKPVKFDPEYRPASGDIVDIFILWRDEKGEKHTDRAQDWIKHVKSGKPMEFDWVFAGSGFWKDEETGKEHYQANVGDFICVSNFPTATLDLPVESSQANADLMFTAFTEKIPPKGTKVRLVLVPRKKAEAKPGEAKPADTKPVEQPK